LSKCVWPPRRAVCTLARTPSSVQRIRFLTRVISSSCRLQLWGCHPTRSTVTICCLYQRYRYADAWQRKLARLLRPSLRNEGGWYCHRCVTCLPVFDGGEGSVARPQRAAACTIQLGAVKPWAHRPSACASCVRMLCWPVCVLPLWVPPYHFLVTTRCWTPMSHFQTWERRLQRKGTRSELERVQIAQRKGSKTKE
jgi:hypothetical protein